jgi:hypothetical protein
MFNTSQCDVVKLIDFYVFGILLLVQSQINSDTKSILTPTQFSQRTFICYPKQGDPEVVDKIIQSLPYSYMTVFNK